MKDKIVYNEFGREMKIIRFSYQDRDGSLFYLCEIKETGVQVEYSEHNLYAKPEYIPEYKAMHKRAKTNISDRNMPICIEDKVTKIYINARHAATGERGIHKDIKRGLILDGLKYNELDDINDVFGKIFKIYKAPIIFE